MTGADRLEAGHEGLEFTAVLGVALAPKGAQVAEQRRRPSFPQPPR